MTPVQKFRLTEKGLITNIYSNQVNHSKGRGHHKPEYTSKELLSWCYENGLQELFDNWVESGRVKDLKPSVDRINDFVCYRFDNIRLVTWLVNRTKQYNDIKTGVSTSGARCKAVIQKDLDGNVLNTFVSSHDAYRTTGVAQGDISQTCLNKIKTAGGFIWSFV